MRKPPTPLDNELMELPFLKPGAVLELDEEYPAMDDKDVADLADGGPRDAGGDPYPSQ